MSAECTCYTECDRKDPHVFYLALGLCGWAAGSSLPWINLFCGILQKSRCQFHSKWVCENSLQRPTMWVPSEKFCNTAWILYNTIAFCFLIHVLSILLMPFLAIFELLLYSQLPSSLIRLFEIVKWFKWVGGDYFFTVKNLFFFFCQRCWQLTKADTIRILSDCAKIRALITTESSVFLKYLWTQGLSILCIFTEKAYLSR